MTYLYLTHDKGKKSAYLDLLGYIDFKNFKHGENCCVIHNNCEINFCVLPELKYGIADKIFRIERNTLHFIDDDTNKSQKPAVKSSRLFFDSMRIDAESYKNLFSKLTVFENDYDSFVAMIMRFEVIDIERKRLHESFIGRFILEDVEKICEIFVKSGNSHLFLQKRIIHGSDDYSIEILYETIMKFRENIKFYRCKDENSLFELLLLKKSLVRRAKFSIMDIAKYNCWIDLSEKNYEILKKLPGNGYKYRTVEFYETQIFCEGKKLSILDEIPDALANLIKTFDSSPLSLYLTDMLLQKLKRGEKIIKNFDRLAASKIPEDKKLELFNLTFAEDLRKEKNFRVFARMIDGNLTIPMKERIFDILMDNIEFDIVNINAPDSVKIFSSMIDDDRKNKFADFLNFSHKEEIQEIHKKIDWKKIDEERKISRAMKKLNSGEHINREIQDTINLIIFPKLINREKDETFAEIFVTLRRGIPIEKHLQDKVNDFVKYRY